MSKHQGPGVGALKEIGSKAAPRATYQPRKRTREENGKPAAVTFFVPREAHAILRGYCHEHSTSLQQIITAAVDEWARKEQLPPLFPVGGAGEGEA